MTALRLTTWNLEWFGQLLQGMTRTLRSQSRPITDPAGKALQALQRGKIAAIDPDILCLEEGPSTGGVGHLQTFCEAEFEGRWTVMTRAAGDKSHIRGSKASSSSSKRHEWARSTARLCVCGARGARHTKSGERLLNTRADFTSDHRPVTVDMETALHVQIAPKPVAISLSGHWPYHRGMSTEQILLFSLFGGVFALLLWGRFRYDMVAFGALMLAVLLGLVPAADAFAGFGHPAVIVVALVLVVSAGLVRSGAVLLITRTLIDASRSLGAHIAIMGGVGGILSAFMNNVAALALLMPVDIATARKAGRAPGLSLMPLSFATILGGMITLIGTPPNIIIATFREDALGAPFAMFDFAPVGAVAAIAGLLFVAGVGWRLIPVRDSGVGGDRVADLKPYLAELSIPEGSKVAGKRLRDLEEDAAKADVALLGIVRDGKRRYGTGRNLKLAEGDILVIEADPAALDEFRATEGLETPQSASGAGALGDGVTLVEMAVPDTARIAGRTVTSIGLSWRQNTTLLGIAREGRSITKSLRKTVIRPGDILLLLAPTDRAEDVVAWLGGMTLADRGLSVTQEHKTWAAIALFAGAVLAAALGLVYLPVALGVVVLGFVAMGVVPLRELYDRIEWPVVVLLGSMIPLGAALETSGGTELIAGGLVGLTEGWPAWAILTVLMVVTMTLSDILNNTATAIVAAPVAVTMAERLGVNPDPFLMAVAVAASAAFLTPIGHKNNTLILGPGGYRFGDYWRMGLPLEILIIAVSIPALLVFWPL